MKSIPDWLLIITNNTETTKRKDAWVDIITLLGATILAIVATVGYIIAKQLTEIWWPWMMWVWIFLENWRGND